MRKLLRCVFSGIRSRCSKINTFSITIFHQTQMAYTHNRNLLIIRYRRYMCFAEICRSNATRHTQLNGSFNVYYPMTIRSAQSSSAKAHRTSFRFSRTVAQWINLVRCYPLVDGVCKILWLLFMRAWIRLTRRSMQLLDRHNPIGCIMCGNKVTNTLNLCVSYTVYVCTAPFHCFQLPGTKADRAAVLWCVLPS